MNSHLVIGNKRTSRIKLIALMDMIFILLIFFIVTAILSFQGGAESYREGYLSLHLPENLGSETNLDDVDDANFLIYIDKRPVYPRVKYTLLHIHLGNDEFIDLDRNPQYRDYTRLLRGRGIFPRVFTRDDVMRYRQDGLQYNHVTRRIKQFKERIKRSDPKIIIAASRPTPFFEVVKLYNYCIDELGLNYVSLNIAEDDTALFDKVSY